MKQRFFLLFLSLVFLNIYTVNAQKARINTDRPDQTDGPFTVPHKAIQLENGVTIAKQTLVNNFLLRYGAGKTTELRMEIDAGKDAGFTGVEPILFGIKQTLIQQKGALPTIGIIGNVSYGELATGSFVAEEWDYELKLAFDNELSNGFSIGYDAGVSDRFNNFNWTFEGAYDISDNSSVFLESYGTFSGGGNAGVNMDAGFLYGITRRFQVDIAGSIPIGGNLRVPKYLTFGVAYIFD